MKPRIVTVELEVLTDAPLSLLKQRVQWELRSYEYDAEIKEVRVNVIKKTKKK